MSELCILKAPEKYLNMNKDISSLIREAIETSKQIIVKMKYGLGTEITVDFQPYIHGHDIMQFEFTWGYLPFNKVFYKIHLENIISINISEITFTVLPEAIYLWSIEEEHFATLVGFRNIFSASCISASPENKPPTPSES